VVQRDCADRAAVHDALGAEPRSAYRRGDDLARDTLAQARRYKTAVDKGKVASLQALRRGIGRSNGHLVRQTLTSFRVRRTLAALILGGLQPPRARTHAHPLPAVGKWDG